MQILFFQVSDGKATSNNLEKEAGQQPPLEGWSGKMPLSKILKEGKECSKQRKFPEGRRVHGAEPTAKVLGGAVVDVSAESQRAQRCRSREQEGGGQRGGGRPPKPLEPGAALRTSLFLREEKPSGGPCRGVAWPGSHFAKITLAAGQRADWGEGRRGRPSGGFCMFHKLWKPSFQG